GNRMSVSAVELDHAHTAAAIGLESMTPRAPDAAFFGRLGGEPRTGFIVTIAPASNLWQSLQALKGFFLIDWDSHGSLQNSLCFSFFGVGALAGLSQVPQSTWGVSFSESTPDHRFPWLIVALVKRFC